MMVTVFYCVLLAILSSYQAYGAVNLQLDVKTTTCAEGIEIVDQRVCPQQGFVCMTNTGVTLWETNITTSPANILLQTSDTIGVPAVSMSASDGTELFVTNLTDVTSGNLTSTLTITNSYNIDTATVVCSDGAGSGAGINMEYHVLQVVTSVPSPPNIMYSVSDAVCDNTMPGTADVTVSWQCPVTTGAAVITGFPVSVNGTILTNASGTDSSYSIPGLPLGATHDIAVAASNCLGTSVDGQVQVFLPEAPFPPNNLAVRHSSCDQLTITWQNDMRNGDLPCPLTGIEFDYTISGTSAPPQSLSVTDTSQTVDIAVNNGTYDITVSYINGRGSRGDTTSLSDVSRATGDFIDSNNAIQVRMDSTCTGDFGVIVNYGLSGSGLNMTSSCVRFEMGLAQVPLSNLMELQSYSYTYTLYRGGDCGGDILEHSEMMMFTTLLGCSRDDLVTSGRVTIIPDRAEYVHEEMVTYDCSGRDEINGPTSRTCRNGVWDPPLTEETLCSTTGLSLGAAIGTTFALTFLVAFVAGLLVAFVIAYCYIKRQKGQYSPSDSQTLTYVRQDGIELKENISYGPVPSQPPAPQQRASMYEEVVQTGNIEVKANVAYGPVSH